MIALSFLQDEHSMNKATGTMFVGVASLAWRTDGETTRLFTSFQALLVTVRFVSCRMRQQIHCQWNYHAALEVLQPQPTAAA